MSDSDLELPGEIGPYRVVRALARGGMAAVYEVVERDTGERYALKLLTQRGLARPRFDREYRALTRLDHPNVVRVYRFGFVDDSPYLTMELLDGVAAQVHAKACGRPGNARRTAEVVRIVTHVADALDYLHTRGMVHRDLKSSNVMVLPDGRVKLLDFGTARMGGQVEEITRKGEFVGTFAYASPEQLQGREVDARADIYSLGVLFYRLLTGKRPFEAESPHALAMMHIEQDPRPPRELAVGLPPLLNDLVLQMLAKQPELRPATTKEVADRLREYAAADGPAEARPAAPLPPTLIGREDVLATLRAIVDKARPGRMLLLVGPSGSGRRRLLDQAAMDAHRKGRRVFRGELPGTSALGPLAEIVERCVRDLDELPGGGSEADKVADLPRGTVPSPAEQAEIFQAVSSALMRRQQADRRPIVLVLSDLHRAPPLAIQALRLLRIHAEEKDVPILVLASTVPEADRPGSLMRRQFTDAVRVPLEPLSPREVGRLVGSMLGRMPPPPELARRIHEATGGLPGYVEEVVRAMVEDGLVEGRPSGADGVEWVDRSGGRVAIPSSAREVLSLRLQSLGGPARRLVGALAVAGGTASTALLAHAADLDPALAHELLEELSEDGLLVAEDGGPWSFRLGLTADLVDEDLRPTRRLVLERRLAERMRDAPPTPAKIRLMLSAGELRQAVQDAVAWARPELEPLPPSALLPELERVAEALAARPPDAEGAELPASLLARFYLCIARAVVDRDPSDARAEGYLDRAGALASGWARKAEVFLDRAHCASLRGDSAGERASISRARDLLDHVPDPELRLAVHLAAGRRAQADGDAEQALELFREAQRAAEQGGDLRGAATARARVGLARFALGELEAAERTLQGAAEAFQRLDEQAGGWRARGWLAEVHLVQARFSEATHLLLPGLDDLRSTAPGELHARVLVQLLEVLVEMFRLGEARELMAELRAIDPAGHGPALRARRALVQGRLLLAGDEPLTALNVLGPAEELAARQEQPVEQGLLMAWSGVAAFAAGDRHQADDRTRRALATLRRERHLPALAAACACRAAVSGGVEDPDLTFRPVMRWMDGHPARVARMDWLLARVDHAIARGDLRQAVASIDRADRLIEDIASRLDEADRAALRVHPWRRRLARYQGELHG